MRRKDKENGIWGMIEENGRVEKRERKREEEIKRKKKENRMRERMERYTVTKKEN